MESKSEARGSFVKQAVILASAGMLVRLIGFLYRLPLTGMIGDEGNGIYGRGYNIYLFFLILSSAGLPAAISKMVSERIALQEYKNAHKIFKVSLMAAAVIGFAASLALALSAGAIANLSQSPRSTSALLSLAPTLFFVALLAVFRGYFQGMNNTVPTAVSQTVEQVFNAFFSVFLAYTFVNSVTDDPIAWGATGGTIGTGIGAVAGLAVIIWIYYLAKPRIISRTKKDTVSDADDMSSKDIVKTLAKIAIPMIIGAAIFSIAGLIDLFMVSRRLTDIGYTPEKADELYGLLTGKYTVLTTLPVAISTALATAAIPSIAASVALKKYKTVKNKINLSFRISMILSIPSAIGLAVLGDQILATLFPNYPGGGVLVTVGAVSIIFLAVVQIVTGMLQAVGRVNVPVIGAAVGVLLKIPLNYILIGNPDINVLGAVISSIVCYIVAAAIDLYFLTKITKVKPNYKMIMVKPLIASCVMGVVCYIFYTFFFFLLGSNAIATIIAIVIGMVSYFFFMLYIKGLYAEDIARFPGGRKLCTSLRKLKMI